MGEGHAPGPAGPPEYDHCGEKEEAQQRNQAPEEDGSGPYPDQHVHGQPTFLASGARTAWWAAAAVPIDLIHTRGSISAGRGLALIDVWRENGCVSYGRRVGGCASGHLTHSYLG